MPLPRSCATAVIKPFATSLAALPVISAIPAGGTLAMVNAIFARCEMSRGLRYFALLLFAINPLFIYYAGNGLALTTNAVELRYLRRRIAELAPSRATDSQDS